MSRRRPTSDRPANSRDAKSRVPSRYGERHVRTVDSEQERPVSLASLVGKDRRDSPAVQLDGGKRESDGVVGALIAVSNAAGGKGPNFGHAGSGGTRKAMAGTSPAQLPRGPPSCPRRRATTPEPAMGCGHAARGSVFPRPVRPHLQKWRSVGGVGAGPSRSWGGGGVDALTIAAVEEDLHARMSGRLWVQRRIACSSLQRWPSQRSMKRARVRTKASPVRARSAWSDRPSSDG